MPRQATPRRSATAAAIPGASHTTAAAVITPFDQLPDSAMLREAQLVKKPSNPAPVVPVSASTLWRWVRAGTFPAPLKIGPNITAWKVGDVRQWLQSQTAVAA